MDQAIAVVSFNTHFINPVDILGESGVAVNGWHEYIATGNPMTLAADSYRLTGDLLDALGEHGYEAAVTHGMSEEFFSITDVSILTPGDDMVKVAFITIGFSR